MNTHAQNILMMQHALGKTPDSRHDLYGTYNAAARALFTHRQWSWRTSQPTTFTFTAGASDLALPTDCEVVEEVICQNGLLSRIAVVPLADLIRARAAQTTPGFNYIVAVESWNPGTPPTRRVHIYPTPPTNLDATLIYTRRWIDATSPGAGFPNIPPEWEHALILIARAYAMHIENQTDTLEDSAYNAEIARLAVLDNQQTQNIGQMQADWNRTNRWTGPRNTPIGPVTIDYTP